MYYKQSEWPASDEVASLCDENEVFLLCYKELYYRHIFVHGAPMLIHRYESWENYCALFNNFLDGANTENLRIPLEWAADMIDEFIYQFQDFCQYRARVTNLSEEEIKALSVSSLKSIYIYIYIYIIYIYIYSYIFLISIRKILQCGNVKLYLDI